ncbi:hypothetical protein LQV63_22555 [Paenibacillus profundus]|uniref:Uncharacterized protein n=1 Tax=Paenibacillus profundus TaxID=1173085 RepID=A0ABS8YJT0_9BACL|nr:hypothetical protein [Paenibacillus profundus]
MMVNQQAWINLLLYKTGEGNYDLGIMIRYQDGKETTKLYAAEDGKVRYIPNLYIPAGATLFFVIEAKVFSDPSDVYSIYLVDPSLEK